jgi:hypothetical protein
MKVFVIAIAAGFPIALIVTWGLELEPTTAKVKAELKKT